MVRLAAFGFALVGAVAACFGSDGTNVDGGAARAAMHRQPPASSRRKAISARCCTSCSPS